MRPRLALLTLVLLGLGPAGTLTAQGFTPFTEEENELALKAWQEFRDAAGANADYVQLVDRWLADPRVSGIVEQKRVLDWYVGSTRSSIDTGMAKDEARLARSVNAAASNPRSVGLLERSGIVDRVALALEGSNFVSADENTVTLSLGAAALLVGCGAEEHSLTYDYECGARHVLNKLGGTFSFGGQLPKGEITGFSGFPDADALFDAVSWDVKLRLVGDRDPRARAWRSELLGRLGARMGFLTIPASDGNVPLKDRKVIAQHLHDEAKAETERVLRRIKRSLQVSIKASGQHLTSATGMNKFGFTLLADKGLGAWDGTLNASFERVQDASMGGAVFDLQQWKIAAGFTRTVLQDVLVKGRGGQLSLSGEALIPQDPAATPLDRKTVWRGDLALTFPVGDSGRIPVSVTYTNDPNNLTKDRFVRGQVGINYDFGALKSLLHRGSN